MHSTRSDLQNDPSPRGACAEHLKFTKRGLTTCAVGGVAASVACVVAAKELAPLDVRHVMSDHSVRFIAREEWGFLSSFTDCPGQDRTGHGPAKHPVILKASHKEIEVRLGEEMRVIRFLLPDGTTYSQPAREWVLRKVVCGSKGYALLYSDAFDSGRSFVVNRFDHSWRAVGADIYFLPAVQFQGYPGGTLGKMVWRFAEKPSGFDLTILDIAENKDRTIDSAGYVALARHDFLVAKRPDSLSGYADRPGPALTSAYLASLPVQVLPDLKVPRAIERHEVELGNWAGTIRVKVEIADKPLFLLLRAHHPVHWVLAKSPSALIHVVHLWGPPPQTIEGLAKDAVVLQWAEQGGKSDHDTAITLIGSLTEPAKSKQVVPQHRKDDTIVVDGKLGAIASGAPRHIYHPDLTPGISPDILARIANCASLNGQDDRIGCYRLRAEILRGKRKP